MKSQDINFDYSHKILQLLTKSFQISCHHGITSIHYKSCYSILKKKKHFFLNHKYSKPSPVTQLLLSSHLFLATQVTNYCQLNLRDKASVKYVFATKTQTSPKIVTLSQNITFLKTCNLTLHTKVKIFCAYTSINMFITANLPKRSIRPGKGEKPSIPVFLVDWPAWIQTSLPLPTYTIPDVQQATSVFQFPYLQNAHSYVQLTKLVIRTE